MIEVLLHYFFFSQLVLESRGQRDNVTISTGENELQGLKRAVFEKRGLCSQETGLEPAAKHLRSLLLLDSTGMTANSFFHARHLEPARKLSSFRYALS